MVYAQAPVEGRAFEGQHVVDHGLDLSIDEQRIKALFEGGDNGGFLRVGAAAQYRAEQPQSLNLHLQQGDLGFGTGQDGDDD